MVGRCYVHRCEARDFTPEGGNAIRYSAIQLSTLAENGDAGEMVNVTGSGEVGFEGRGDYDVHFKLTARDGKTLLRVTAMFKVAGF